MITVGVDPKGIIILTAHEGHFITHTYNVAAALALRDLLDAAINSYINEDEPEESNDNGASI